MSQDKYRFAVGVAQKRTVTVLGKSLEDAEGRAREVLDRRAEKAGREPPVGWDLALVAQWTRRR